MGVDSVEFRRVLGHLPTGVTVVASVDPRSDTPCGLTANAVTSVSLEPPLVLVCVDRAADTHACIEAAGFFSINILMAEQEGLARRFAAWDVAEKFRDVPFRTVATGAPVIENVLAWVDCWTHAAYPGGDHTIYVGEVVAADARPGLPLVFYRGGYGRFMP